MKTKKNNFRLLTFSVFLHLICCFCAFYRDSYTWPNGYKEINYWFNFLAWWSVQASLVTFIYFVYRLFKKSPHSYFDKVFDLVVINANLISIGIFSVALSPLLWGGKTWTVTPRKGGIIDIFFFKIDRRIFWWTYSIIWHYLTRILTIVYFARRKISLAQTYYERRWLFFYSLIHPFCYTVFVLCRPLIPGSANYPYGKSKYPYFFFDWMTRNDFRHIFWALTSIAVIFFFVVAFWFSVLFFWWYSGHKLSSKRERIKDKTLKEK